MLLAHTSDWHIRGDNTHNNIIIQRLTKLKQYIKNKYPDEELFIASTGDNTDDGNKGQYNNLNMIIQQLKLNIFLTIGNHDVHHHGIETIGSPFRPESYEMFNYIQHTHLYNLQKQFKPHIIYTTIPFENTNCFKYTITLQNDLNHTILILLDSNIINGNPLTFAKGELGKEVLQHITHINTCYDKSWLRIIMLHHHPIFNNHFQLMEDADKFLQLIWNMGHQNIILFGHKHNFSLQSTPDGYIAAANKFSKENELKINLFNIKYDINKEIHNIGIEEIIF